MKLFKMLREYKSLENAINAQKAALDNITQSASKAQHEFELANQSLRSINTQISEAKAKLDVYDGRIESIAVMEEYGIPDYTDSLETFEHMRYLEQEKVDAITSKGKNKEGGLWYITRKFALNDSASQGRVMQESFAAGICYALNAYLDKKDKSATVNNRYKLAEDIRKKFDFYQARAKKVGIEINPDYVEARIKIIQLNAEIKVREKNEKAKLREERRRQKEAEQLAREIEKARAEINAERLRFDKALGRATTEEERKEIKRELAQLDKRERDLNYREQHSRSGWLYIIDTPAMPGIEKIGCSQRIDPLQRVAELSSASVPFPFIVRGLVFSDDVFTLENEVHKYFHEQRVNKTNLHKEFFYVTPEQVIDVLRKKFHCEVHFIDKTEQEEVIENG